jgi:protein-S-isoprenylcysteine O-methyltransferase Ste14
MNRNGIRGIIVQSILIIIGFVILFVAAGTLKWVNGWIYVFLIAVSQAASWIVLAKINPQLLNARSSIVKEGTKGFDRVWLVLYPIFTFGNLVVMGFDAVRFHWSSMPGWLTIVGVAMFIPALVTATWAMSVNKFFEWTVRIQDDRSQYVCTDGPYSVIRHPGYTGLIVSLLAYPLILGSWWGLVASFILTAIIVVRTVLEDRTLQIELPGYKEYAGKVKYRLLPFIW